MSETVPNPLVGLNPAAAYLSPGEVAHVARNVFETGIGPMALEFQVMRAGFRRLFGDDEDSGIPEQLRSKGLLCEIKDGLEASHTAQTSNMEEQRGWKAQQDAKDLTSEEERKLILANQADIITRVTKLESNGHKVRRLAVWFVRVMTKKDDGASILIGKLIVFAGFITGAGVGTYKFFAWLLHALAKFVTYLYHQG